MAKTLKEATSTPPSNKKPREKATLKKVRARSMTTRKNTSRTPRMPSRKAS